MKAQRQVWGETLAELAAQDKRLLVLDGDLANSTKADTVAKRVPESFIEVGIAEQNLIGMAFGLATVGYRPWISTFGVFLTHRALDQIRMLISQTRVPVRLSGAYTGLLNGSSGKTHQDIEDLAIMRAMPHMTVLAPADEFEAEAVTRWAAEYDGPVYLRYARDAVSPIFAEGVDFTLGAPRVLRRGNGPTVVSTGVQTSRTAEALELLDQKGHDLTHIHLATLKPLDERAIKTALADTQHVISVEEHSRIGGLGGLIAELITAEPSAPLLTRLGLEDRWSESAPNSFLLDRYGLSPERVAEQIEAAIVTTTAQ